jgi:hypothetical protein
VTVAKLERDVKQEQSWQPATPTYTVASGIVWVTLEGPDHETVKLYVPVDKMPAIGGVYTLTLVPA